jgi:ribokinase
MPDPSRVGGSVVVLGSINRDVVAQVERLPRPGETVSAHAGRELPGGKGANQAVAAAHAGASVRMVAAVGDDTTGADLIAFLRDRRVDTSAVVRREGAPTGRAFVVVSHGGENQIVVMAGANATVDDTLVDDVALGPADLVVAQHETPVGVSTRLFERAGSVGAQCLLNPAPAAPIGDELLRCTTVLVANEHELGAVVGRPSTGPLDADDVRNGAQALRTSGFTGSLVVTLGRRGAMAVIDGETRHVAGHAVDVLDTTGAGDCFVGYLAAELLAGSSFGDALVTSNAAAALCTTREGAAPSMPRRAEVVEFLGAAARRPTM